MQVPSSLPRARKLPQRARGPQVEAQVLEPAARTTAARHAALGEPARLALVRLLARHGSLCVCELHAALPLAQPTVSHHLKVLREAGLVEAERRGTWVYYRLCREPLKRLVVELLELL